MDLYHYSPENGEYLSTTEAFLDPLETERSGSDVYLIPALATTTPPPQASDKEAVVFENGAWVIKPDHRGETWYKAYNEPVVIKEIGNPINDGFTKIEPSKPAPTNEDVNTERERRVNLVVPVYLSTGKVFAVDMAGGGRANIGDLALMAVIKNGAGVTTDFTFRDANDTDQTLTNDEVIEMGMQAAASFDYYYKKSWALKELSPIPQDYEDDSYWT